MRIGLYLPDDKKELYEEAKKRLEKEGRSVSQLFLEALESYMNSSAKKTLSKENVIKDFQRVVNKYFPWLEFTEGKLGKLRPEALMQDKFKTIGVVEIKEVPYDKQDVLRLGLPEEMAEFDHSPVIKPYLPYLVKQNIPLFVVIYVGKDGVPLKIDLIKVFDFEKFSANIRDYVFGIEKDVDLFSRAESIIKDVIEAVLEENKECKD